MNNELHWDIDTRAGRSRIGHGSQPHSRGHIESQSMLTLVRATMIKLA